MKCTLLPVQFYSQCTKLVEKGYLFFETYEMYIITSPVILHLRRIIAIVAIWLFLIVPSAGAQTTLFQEEFDDNNLASRGWFDNTAASISTSNTIPGSSGSLEFAWPTGAVIPTNGGAKRKLFSPTESVYLRFYIKFSAGWQGSGVSYHPHLFYLLTTEDDQWIGPSETHLTFYLEPVGSEGKIRVAFQDSLNIDQMQIGVDLTPEQPNHTEFRGTGGCNGTTDGVVGDCYNNPPWRNGKAYTTAQGYADDTFKKVELLVLDFPRTDGHSYTLN